MSNPVHIAETAILLAIAYQAGWFVAFFARRLFAGGRKPTAISAERLAVAKGESIEPLVKAPLIDPVAAMPVPANPAAAAGVASTQTGPAAVPTLPAALPLPLPPLVMPPTPAIPAVDLGALPPVTESAALSSFLEVLEATPAPEDLESPAPNPKSIPAVERMLAEVLGLEAGAGAGVNPAPSAIAEETLAARGVVDLAAETPATTVEPEPEPELSTALSGDGSIKLVSEDSFAPQATPLFVADLEPASEGLEAAAGDATLALPVGPGVDRADPLAADWPSDASADAEQVVPSAPASEKPPDRFEPDPAPFELAVATAVEAAAAAVQSLLPPTAEPDAASEAPPQPEVQDIAAAEPKPEFVFELPPAAPVPPPRAEPDPEPPPPALKPASRPGEAWSGRPVPPSPSVLAAVVGAALDIDAEAEAMRAVEGGWTRRSATPAPAPIAVQEPEPEPAAVAGPQTHVEGGFGRPPALAEPRSGGKDDLRQIKAVAAADEAALNALGIFHFDQIAAWDQKAVVWMENREFGRGRIAREKWLEQARDLARGRAPVRVVRR